MKPTIEFHTVANIFPMMTDAERVALEQDIKDNGLLEPIWLYDGKIIDGRNRYLACIAAGIKPIFRDYTGSENQLLDFVVSLNLHRRHLSQSQLACLAVDIMPEIEKQSKERAKQKISAARKNVILSDTNIDKSRDIAGKIFGVSGRYISSAMKLKEHSQELYEQVQKGVLTLTKAGKQLSKVSETVELIPQTQIPTEPITTLSKSDLKRIDSLVSFGMQRTNAEKYVISNKRTTKPKQTANTLKEVKFRLPETDKSALQKLADKRKISISELLRNLVSENIA